MANNDPTSTSEKPPGFSDAQIRHAALTLGISPEALQSILAHRPQHSLPADANRSQNDFTDQTLNFGNESPTTLGSTASATDFGAGVTSVLDIAFDPEVRDPSVGGDDQGVVTLPANSHLLDIALISNDDSDPGLESPFSTTPAIAPDQALGLPARAKNTDCAFVGASLPRSSTFSHLPSTASNRELPASAWPRDPPAFEAITPDDNKGAVTRRRKAAHRPRPAGGELILTGHAVACIRCRSQHSKVCVDAGSRFSLGSSRMAYFLTSVLSILLTPKAHV
jgi:hypothetical protein